MRISDWSSDVCTSDLAVGWVRPDIARRLRDFPDSFVVADESVRLHPRLGDFDSRSRAVEAVLLRLRDDGLVPGWRDEAYPVGTDFNLPPLLKMERAAVAGFGVRASGVHVNGHEIGRAEHRERGCQYV